MANVSSFLKFKRGFFEGDTLRKEKVLTIVEKTAADYDYAWIAEQKMLLENECDQLFQVLQKNPTDALDQFAFCLSLATLLKKYYEIYHDENARKRYEDLMNLLSKYIEHDGYLPEPLPKDHFLKRLSYTVRDDILWFLGLPLHLGRMRMLLSIFNNWRIYWSCQRVLLISMLAFVQETKRLAALFKFVDFDKTLKILDAANPATRILSVAYFGVRITMNLLMMTRVLIFHDKRANAPFFQELKNELWKRHGSFANDIVWALTNFVTNYAPILHISALWTNVITICFLVFDLLLLVWLRQVARQDYIAKKSQYLIEMNRLNDTKQLKLLEQQLQSLEIRWEATSASFYFQMGAASLLILGFSAAFLLPVSLCMLLSFGSCIIGSAMYLSTNAFKNYWETKKHLEYIKMNADIKALWETQRNYHQARREFVITFLKYAMVPTILFTTFILCWQAGLALTLTYATYELLHAVISQAKTRPNENKTATLLEDKSQDDSPSSLQACQI